MGMTFHVDIVSAEAEIFSGKASMLFAPAVMGEVGIAPRHTPLLTRLKPGEVRVQLEGKDEQVFFVSGGMLEVQPHVVTVLADCAMRGKDLDEAHALKVKARAEKAMADKKTEFDYTKATIELAEAMAQLRTIQRMREKTGR